MFEFYINNTYDRQNSFNWVQLLTPIITVIGLWIAYRNLKTAIENLKGVSRTQSLQAHMNLITLENEVRKNSESFRMASNKYDIMIAAYKNTADSDIKPEEITKPLTELDFELLIETKDNTFVLYITSVDKLASLVNTEYLQKQFQSRDWKMEYKDIFKDASIYFEDYNMVISGKSQMIRNITILLEKWDKENTPTLQKRQYLQPK